MLRDLELDDGREYGSCHLISWVLKAVEILGDMLIKLRRIFYLYKDMGVPLLWRRKLATKEADMWAKRKARFLSILLVILFQMILLFIYFEPCFVFLF